MEIKTAVLLCAGLGERMRPLTEDFPKPLLPFFDKNPLWLNALQLGGAGINRLAINRHHLPEKFDTVFSHFWAEGFEVHDSHEPKIMGTGGALNAMRDFLGDEDIVVANGKVLFEMPLKNAIRAHYANNALATLLLAPNPNPAVFSSVVLDADRRVRAIVRKGQTVTIPAGGFTGMFTGVTILGRKLRNILPPGKPDFIWDFLAQHLEPGNVLGYPCKEYFSDPSAPKRYARVHFDILEGRAPQLRHLLRASAANPKGSSEYVWLGHDVEIADGAHLGTRVVLGDRVRVRPGVRLENCIVWPGTTVTLSASNAILTPRHTVSVA